MFEYLLTKNMVDLHEYALKKSSDNSSLALLWLCRLAHM